MRPIVFLAVLVAAALCLFCAISYASMTTTPCETIAKLGLHPAACVQEAQVPVCGVVQRIQDSVIINGDSVPSNSAPSDTNASARGRIVQHRLILWAPCPCQPALPAACQPSTPMPPQVIPPVPAPLPPACAPAACTPADCSGAPAAVAVRVRPVDRIHARRAARVERRHERQHAMGL